jgi:hypothetical protein
MRNGMTKFLLTVSAFLTLAPATALALRPDCDWWCTANDGIAFCSDRCTIPYTIQVITCGEWVASYGYQYPEATCAPSVAAPEDSDADRMQDSDEDAEETCRAPARE